jgi:hypothetical protein
MALKTTAIQRMARLAARSPSLRSTLIRVLNRTPVLKARLKRELARASTLAAQASTPVTLRGANDLFLSREARAVLDDLRAARARVEAQSASERSARLSVAPRSMSEP